LTKAIHNNTIYIAQKEQDISSRIRRCRRQFLKKRLEARGWSEPVSSVFLEIRELDLDSGGGRGTTKKARDFTLISQQVGHPIQRTQRTRWVSLTSFFSFVV
jgi:hypothetical protein